MELTTAIHNHNLLSNLKPFQKLIVDEENKFQKDLRWGQFVRRAITDDSKEKILKPLTETVDTMIEYFASKSDVRVVHSMLSTLNNLENTLLQTYPNWEELSTCIVNLKEGLSSDFNIPKVKLEDVHPTEQEMIQLDAEINHEYGNVSSNFVIEDVKDNVEDNVIDLEDKMVLMEMDLTYIRLENKELKEKIGTMMEYMQSQIDIIKDEQTDIETYLDDNLDDFQICLNNKLSTLKKEQEQERLNLETYIDENFDDFELEYENKLNSIKEDQRIQRVTMEDYVDEYVDEIFDEIQSDIETVNRNNRIETAQLKTLQKLYYQKSKTNAISIKDELDECISVLDEDIDTLFEFIKSKFCKSSIKEQKKDKVCLLKKTI